MVKGIKVRERKISKFHAAGKSVERDWGFVRRDGKFISFVSRNHAIAAAKKAA